MGKNMRRPLTRSGLKKALAAGVALGALGSVALAQNGPGGRQANAPLKLQNDYLGYAAGASARLSYSDNINLRSDGLENDELITAGRLTGGAIVSTRRITALFLGDLDFSYFTDAGDFALNQDIGATSTITAIDDWAYVDVSGASERQLVGDGARFAGSVNAARNQRASVNNYSISPYIYRQMADQSTAELRYRFTQAFVDADNLNTGGLGLSIFDESKTHEAYAAYNSGNRLGRLQLRLSAYGNQTEEDIEDFQFDDGNGLRNFSAFEYQQGSFQSTMQYAVTTQFALTGAVGYDQIDTDDAAELFINDSEISGIFWRAGFSARPGRRSQIRIEYGERYGDDFVNFDASYQLSNRIQFNARAGRSFNTRSQSITTQFQSTQRRTLDFADQLRSGREISPRNIIEQTNRFSRGIRNQNRAQTAGVAVSNNASATLTGNFGRTTGSLAAFYNDDSFGFRDAETIGVSANLRRNFSRRLSGFATVNYRNTEVAVDFDACLATPITFGLDPAISLALQTAQCQTLSAGGSENTTVVGRIGASYRFYGNVAAFADYSRAERFSQEDFLEYSENAVVVGVTLDF